jgi:fructose-bisphosphate aldolase class I
MPGKGILAADESTGTCTRRFEAVGIESNEENRRKYRQMLFTTEGIGEFVSGAILYDETIRQADDNGIPFAALLQGAGVLTGIKVDTGAKPLAGCEGETVTEGLDGLRERLAEYNGLGAHFAKWRAVIHIGDGKPSRCAMLANAQALARYAALCQEAGIVPIVEPEVLIDGDHTLERCYEATTQTLKITFDALWDHKIYFGGMLLKPSMVISGKDCPQQAEMEQVANATVRALRECVPATVPGCVFLSGGQSPLQATAHLNAMNAIGVAPWALSFSYGRALQEPALAAFAADMDDVESAQKQFYARAKLNSAAAQGQWTPELEAEVAAAAV